MLMFLASYITCGNGLLNILPISEKKCLVFSEFVPQNRKRHEVFALERKRTKEGKL
jgi:hypothetical protein